MSLADARRGIMGAGAPEDLFGTVSAGGEARQINAAYRALAAIVHPDHNAGSDESKECFAKLNRLRTEALQKVRRGIYGDRMKAADGRLQGAVITTATRRYHLPAVYAEGDYCDVFEGSAEESGRMFPALVKLAREPRDNDLVENETRMLRLLLSGPAGAQLQLPAFLEPVEVRDGGVRRLGLAFRRVLHTVTFEEIRRAFPKGVPAVHGAWMWRRLLWILHYAHTHGIVHGAVVPSHCMPRTEHDGKPAHGLVLLDWSYAVRDPSNGVRVGAIAPLYRELYAPEILRKERVYPATDIYMAAASVLWVMGGRFENGKKLMPKTIPEPMRAALAECLKSDPRMRPRNALEFHERLAGAFQSAFGAPKFHPFSMPAGWSRAA